MALSDTERQELRDRAAGLRAEVSSLNAQREALTTEASRQLEDERLLAEVAKLEAERETALQSRDSAAVGVASAAEIMAATAAESQPASPPSPSAPAENKGTKPSSGAGLDFGGEDK